MTAKMNADNRYAGLICKNPFNSQWRTLELHHSLFSLVASLLFLFFTL